MCIHITYTHTHTNTYTHTQWNIIQPLKKKKKNSILPLAITWTDLDGIMTKRNKLDKDKYHMISLLCGILR